MQGDVFTNTNSSGVKNDSSNNFFVQPVQKNMLDDVGDLSRHLNDYDFNILQEEAYKDINDDRFKLEYKINRLVTLLNDVNSKIDAANDINDEEQIKDLEQYKSQIQKQLNELDYVYKNSGISAKLSGRILNNKKTKFGIFKETLLKYFGDIIKKLPVDIPVLSDVRASLDKLETINKNVDMLMSSHIPYGEAEEKYDKLSKYIVRANILQSELSKYFAKK